MARHAIPEVSITWIPAAEWTAAVERWPGWKDDYDATTYEEYCRHLEAQLRGIHNAGTSGLSLSPLHVDEYVAWCEGEDMDPADGTSRAHFAAEMGRLGRPRAVLPLAKR